ncbi:hypothetical protein E4U53_000505 [Claviceps sorghi]|nr:hypothetical protein E4U53_000505 [Claviceps sorghi]
MPGVGPDPGCFQSASSLLPVCFQPASPRKGGQGAWLDPEPEGGGGRTAHVRHAGPLDLNNQRSTISITSARRGTARHDTTGRPIDLDHGQVKPSSRHRSLVMQPLGHPMARVALAGGRRMLGLQPPALVAKSRTACRPLSFASSRRILNRANLQSPARATRLFASSANPARAAESRPSSTSSAEAIPEETRAKDEPRPLAVELPSETDSRRSNLNQRFSHVMDNVQARVLTASQTLNDITGYSAIEAIKNENELLEVQLAEAHATVRAARQAYKLSNTKRATTQREVTMLLARKDTWSPSDLERFTELYRTDHELEGEVAKAQEALTESEIEEQSLSQRLNAGILKRYHEEQIWSDRIRRASTWGTWGLMGMNFLLFVVLQFFAEPWRRRRLVRGVVEEGERAMGQVVDELASLKLSLARWEEQASRAAHETAEAPTAHLEAAVPSSAQEPWTRIIMDPAQWRAVAADLCSERTISLRMKDASTLALQGAAAGAAIAVSLVMVLNK